MRVLHVAETLDGGVGRYLAAVTAAQVRAGWEVAVAAPADGPWRDALLSGGAKHLTWEARPQPGLATAREVSNLRPVVADAKPDLVHLHSSKAGLAGRLVVRRRIPTMLQPHSWSFYAVTGPLRRATLTWERFGARWIDAVLCVSQAEADVAAAERIRARCVVVPNGVDLREHRAATQADRIEARERFGISSTTPLVVCVGRLHRQKGQHRLLDAWPQVRAAVTDAALALVGAGPDEQSLRARGVAGVRFVGESTEVASWLAAADVVAAPSTWEGMSLSVLEAMAAGRPVVATEVPGMTEVVTADIGALVPLDDASALAAALSRRLLEPELAAAQGRAAREVVVRDHDLSRHLERVLALSAELAR